MAAEAYAQKEWEEGGGGSAPGRRRRPGASDWFVLGRGTRSAVMCCFVCHVHSDTSTGQWDLRGITQCDSGTGNTEYT